MLLSTSKQLASTLLSLSSNLNFNLSLPTFGSGGQRVKFQNSETKLQNIFFNSRLIRSFDEHFDQNSQTGDRKSI